jgi:hypothetical protein
MIDFGSIKSLTIPEGSVKKITANGVVFWEKVTSRLPSAYQEVEWIGSTGSQKINYSQARATDNEISLKFTIDKYTSMYACGSFFTSPNRAFLLARLSGSQQTFEFYSATQSYVRATNYKLALNTVYEMHLKTDFATLKNTFTIAQNGIVGYTGTSTPDNITTSLTTFCVCHSGGLVGNENAGLQGKMYSYQHKSDGVIVRDFIPCYRKSDGVIGMYDIVSNSFYTNQGSGSFTKGANI